MRRRIINGWELAPLIRIQTGSPFSVTAGGDDSLTDVGNDRPNLVAGMNPYAEVKFHKATGETNREFLNPAAFREDLPQQCDSRLRQCRHLWKYQQELVPWAEDVQLRRPDFKDVSDPRELEYHPPSGGLQRSQPPELQQPNRVTHLVDLRPGVVHVQRRPRFPGQRKGLVLAS